MKTSMETQIFFSGRIYYEEDKDELNEEEAE